jgi:DMSO/TMAO reductase YedYZ molybdopterin-dependent catalytic subunit
VASVLALVPEWALPALARGDEDVPFTDIPATFNPNNPTGATRLLDIRKIDGLITPNDQFFFIQHYNKPEIDPAAYRLKLTGLVHRPIELTVADLKAMKSVEIVNGYECSGNSARARWRAFRRAAGSQGFGCVTCSSAPVSTIEHGK